MENGLSIGQNGDQKPPNRTRILGLRISESEYAALEKRAWQSGKTVADWAREVLLRSTHSGNSGTMQTHIFTELIAIQLLVMNAFEPLLRGEKLSREQVAGIFREVQATKTARAQELLMKRAHTREK